MSMPTPNNPAGMGDADPAEREAADQAHDAEFTETTMPLLCGPHGSHQIANADSEAIVAGFLAAGANADETTCPLDFLEGER